MAEHTEETNLLQPTSRFQLLKDILGLYPAIDGEKHKSTLGTAGWLRAGVLGANDAIVSVAAVMVGVAANQSNSQGQVLIAALAALFAGALSMAVGEYVSVASQKDMEDADLEKERWELENNPEGELEELSLLYQERGVDPVTATEVARQLMAKDALQAHAIEELGIRDFSQARPFAAGMVSFAMFITFGCIPLLVGAWIPYRWYAIGAITGVSLILLAISGAVGAFFGGANMLLGAFRVTYGGALAMAITIGVGFLSETLNISDMSYRDE